MHDIAHVTSENDLCTRPKKSVGYKGHLLCADVSAITSYKVRACPCKSSDVISLKYTDIRRVFNSILGHWISGLQIGFHHIKRVMCCESANLVLGRGVRHE